MGAKIKLTRPELKRYRDELARFGRYLPMLKLKQQQLQIVLRQVSRTRRQAADDLKKARAKLEPYQAVLSDIAGLNVRELSKPQQVKTSSTNIAGLNIPVFQDVTFETPNYSLFATAAWVDQTLLDLRKISTGLAKLDIINQQQQLLQQELTKITQRVNLFEKVKIPQARDAIRVIRIKLGDEMTAAVARAKIAKAKITQADDNNPHVSQTTSRKVPA